LGGCLDSDGVHSRALFLSQFIAFNLVTSPKDYPLFQDAYTYSDKKVINESLIVNANLLEMNELMCFFIGEKLGLNNPSEISKVAHAITKIQAFYLQRNKRILEELHTQYQLGIISNFSGNLMTILDEFSLTPYFSFVLDSYHVGLCKPDPLFFKLGIEKCNTSPGEVCFIGDNIERDIFPAHKLGMKTILISSFQDFLGFPKLSSDHCTVTSLEDLPINRSSKVSISSK
jgi:putative hydrolase of the HAD superfamily